MKRFNSFIVTALAIFAVVAFIGCKTQADSGPGILSVWENKSTQIGSVTATIYDNNTATVTVVTQQDVSGQKVESTVVLNGTITGTDISKAFTFNATSGRATGGSTTTEMDKNQLDMFQNISATINGTKMSITITDVRLELTKK